LKLPLPKVFQNQGRLPLKLVNFWAFLITTVGSGGA
jgi:hypothetical protein